LADELDAYSVYVQRHDREELEAVVSVDDSLGEAVKGVVEKWQAEAREPKAKE
jgi:hypothetical protein